MRGETMSKREMLGWALVYGGTTLIILAWMLLITGSFAVSVMATAACFMAWMCGGQMVALLGEKEAGDG